MLRKLARKEGILLPVSFFSLLMQEGVISVLAFLLCSFSSIFLLSFFIFTWTYFFCTTSLSIHYVFKHRYMNVIVMSAVFLSSIFIFSFIISFPVSHLPLKWSNLYLCFIYILPVYIIPSHNYNFLLYPPSLSFPFLPPCNIFTPSTSLPPSLPALISVSFLPSSLPHSFPPVLLSPSSLPPSLTAISSLLLLSSLPPFLPLDSSSYLMPRG